MRQVVLAGALATLALAGPAASETFVCEPTETVCGGEYSADPDCTSGDYGWRETFVDAWSDGTYAYVGGYRDCDASGAGTMRGRSLDVYAESDGTWILLAWYSFRGDGVDTDGIFARAETPAGDAQAMWLRYTHNGGACTVGLLAPGVTQWLGCPAGPPPASPDVPWGGLLP